MSASTAVRIRLWAWALALRPLKHVVSFATLVRLARTRPKCARSESFERDLEAFMNARAPFPRRAPGNCLERSLGAFHELCAHGSEPRLHVGIRRDDGRVEGHVWVTAGDRPLAERADFLSTFTVVVTYGPDGRPHAASASRPLAGVRLA